MLSKKIGLTSGIKPKAVRELVSQTHQACRVMADSVAGHVTSSVAKPDWQGLLWEMDRHRVQFQKQIPCRKQIHTYMLFPLLKYRYILAFFFSFIVQNRQFGQRKRNMERRARNIRNLVISDALPLSFRPQDNKQLAEEPKGSMYSVSRVAPTVSGQGIFQKTVAPLEFWWR